MPMKHLTFHSACLAAAFLAATLEVLCARTPEPLNWTTQQDHQNMKQQLGITHLRPGPSGNASAHNGQLRLTPWGLQAPTTAPAITAAPATLLGLPGGRLVKGAPADLVLCDLNAPVVIDADKLVSRSKNSPFDGRKLEGRVLRTWVNGATVFERG